MALKETQWLPNMKPEGSSQKLDGISHLPQLLVNMEGLESSACCPSTGVLYPWLPAATETVPYAFLCRVGLDL